MGNQDQSDQAAAAATQSESRLLELAAMDAALLELDRAIGQALNARRILLQLKALLLKAKTNA